MILKKLQALIVATGVLTSLGIVSVFAQSEEQSAMDNIPSDANRPASWTALKALSIGGEGWEATGGLDAQGNAVALWEERTGVTDRIWSRSQPRLGAFGTRTIVSRQNPPLGSNFVFPQMKVSAAGFVTAIWTDYDGLWTADRAPQKAWSASILLLPGFCCTPTLVMNKSGDEAMVWGTGGARAPTSAIVAMRRSAGQPWGAQQNVITGIHLSPGGVALSDNGDLGVAWESYDAVCSKHCVLSNFVMDVSRQARTGPWHDSGALVGPDPNSHTPFIAVDSPGTAGLLFANAMGQLVSIVQASAGQPWSSQASVNSVPGLYVAGFATDATGNATVLLAGTQVIAISGQLATNTWSLPVVISGSDQKINQVIFAEGSNGAAAAAWASGTDFSNNPVRAVTRSSPTSSWSVPVTLSPPAVQLAAPEVLAVNVNGDVLLILSAFNASFANHTEYATSYHP